MKEDFDLIVRMRELHSPAPIDWWPPAPGWWLVPIVFVLFGVGLWIVWWRRKRLCRAGLSGLRQIRSAYRAHRDTLRLTRELSVLLRRVALGRSPRGEVAGLTGEAWLGYLDIAGGSTEFTQGRGRVIATQPYSGTGIAEEEADQLLDLMERWIRRAA